MTKLNLNQLEQLVKEKYSLTKALKKLKPENFYQVGQTCFCPFHDNHNTPAASIYNDEKGQTLYCFTERRLYTVVDVFKELMHYDVYELGLGLWQTMSPEEQHLWLEDNQQYDLSGAFDKVETVQSHNKELEKAIMLFQNRKISLSELLQKYIDSRKEVAI